MYPKRAKSLNQEVNEIFAPLWLDETWRYAIMMGGRGTGRSTAGSQYDLSKLMAPDYMRGAIMRSIHGDIRNSIFQDLKDHVTEHDLTEIIHIKENDMSFEYGKNSIKAHGFKSSSREQSSKLKSLANYTNVRIEEAKDVGESDFMKLDDSLRTVKSRITVIFQLNPPPRNHWIIDRFFDLEEHPDWPGFYIPHAKTNTDDDFIYIGGTFEDNIQNLDATTIKRYRGYERNKPDYYAQEILGLVPGTVRGKIYRGWNQIRAVPREASLIAIGVDWGWYPDPAAVHAIYYASGEYIVKELIVDTEVDDEAMAGFIKAVPGYDRVPTVCGADEPKAVAALIKHGIKNAVHGVTGKGSVDYRIKAVATKKVSVVVDSHNLDSEGKPLGTKTWTSYENYAWDEDKDGNPKGVPNHAFSDPMDSIGYGIGYLSDPEAVGKKVSINKPTFKRYGHVDAPVKSTGKGVSVNYPRRK